MKVELTDRFRPRTPRRLVERVVAAALEHSGGEPCAVSLLLTDDAEIARIHGEFLDDPTPTDVICFPCEDAIDIVVSVECARREARRRGHPIRAELALYIVHGILHARGYDDIDECDRARMRDAERAVLHSLGYHIAPVDA